MSAVDSRGATPGVSVAMTTGLCQPGFGASVSEAAGGDYLACLPCGAGLFSDEVSADPCRPCGAGLGTDGLGATVCVPNALLGELGNNAVALGLAGGLLLLGVVALIVSCCTEKDARHGAIGTVLLSVFDVATDALFLNELLGEEVV